MTKAIFKNVELATNEELINYLKENPETKYIDAITSDLSGLFRGKEYPLRMQKNFLQMEFNSAILLFYLTHLDIVQMLKEEVSLMEIQMQHIIQ